MKEEKDIDKVFRQKLGDPANEPGYREDDWDALEQLMDKGKKRPGVVYWMSIVSAVAAMLLLFLGWWLFKPQTADKTQSQLANVQQQKTTHTHEASIKNNTVQSTINQSSKKYKINNNTIQQPVQQAGVDNYVNNTPKRTNIINYSIPVFEPPVVSPVQNTPAADNPAELIAVNAGMQMNTAINTDDVSAKDISNNDYAKAIAIKRNKITTTSSFKNPQYALTIMGAPDINGVNSFQQTKTGTNLGLLFSVGFNKITITTGAAYSVKPYNTSFDNYHTSNNYTFKTNPVDVLADCRMLDIPLNVDYQLFNKNQNKISIGTGLSSYIMLKESYQYDYADPSIKGPRDYTVPSPGKYFLSVVNLQATYKRQINSKVGVSVQPYMKVPLGEVGASQVKLQSAGVAIGLSWNINSLTKP